VIAVIETAMVTRAGPHETEGMIETVIASGDAATIPAADGEGMFCIFLYCSVVARIMNSLSTAAVYCLVSDSSIQYWHAVLQAQQ
jgi:hypothetical protein